MNDNWTEQETRTRLIAPALTEAGWDLATQVREEVALTAGRIIPGASIVRREKPKRADYVLYISPNIPLAPIEAKARHLSAAAGMQQALAYAKMLKVPFAFSTNGREYLFHDATVDEGQLVEKTLQPDQLPSPEDLWRRYITWKGIKAEAKNIVEQAYHQTSGQKQLRYYQANAVNASTEAIASGARRLLLVMATGTGKTLTAFQLIWRLRSAGIAKRVLFLVDRNVLADQAMLNDFAEFGPVMTKISAGRIDKSYEVYLALYQAITGGEGQELFRQFSPDFFDLIVVDECHRGSASEDSAWRAVLDYFAGAIQVGLTATPKETQSVSNTDYFGEAVFTYSLKDGIADGFLAPYSVRRVELDKDLGGWRPTAGQLDRFGNEVPDRIYMARDYDRKVVLEKRTPVVASSITAFLKANDRYAKTIVFCEDIDHAERMRIELVNANADITASEDKYVVRITGDSVYGAADLEAFMDPDSQYPVIATTSKLLSTGVDIPTCRVIALDQTITSMTEFKQIVGRGTRVREDLGKTSFTILDYRGATQLFADPEFDGDPAVVDLPGPSPTLGACSTDQPSASSTENLTGASFEPRIKYYVDGVEVFVTQERVQFFDNDGKLITESLQSHTQSRLGTLFPKECDFQQFWLGSDSAEAAFTTLSEYGVLVGALQMQFGPSYDLYDVLRHVAYGHSLETKEHRSHRVLGMRNSLEEPAASVLDALVDSYVLSDGIDFDKVSILRGKQFTKLGTPVEIIKSLGGRSAFEALVREFVRRLYVEEI